MGLNIHIALAWLQGALRLPKTPKGQQLDLSKLELTWSDEFEGDSLDLDKWRLFQNHHPYWSLDLARVENGQLHIATRYAEEGMRLHIPEKYAKETFSQEMPEGYRACPDEGYVHCPPGWYSLGITTDDSFRQKFGYFETRCKLPKGVGIWSAFWMMNEQVLNAASSGRGGTEIDVFEAPFYRRRLPLLKNMVTTNLHYGGYFNKTWRMKNIGKFRVNDPYDTFHTYGLEWNENEYVFYIDGVEAGRSSFGGVCQNEVFLHLSVEKETRGLQRLGWAGDIHRNKPGDMMDFVVDYVRAYQYK
ncbi:MAG: glycoside hydrolase family 16 protein [Oscillospiraceae bacterium]|jgi:hypothetical protein|nr:glycoside hydrolase family 16 protein [Oscillospiraceae bacterium]